MSIILDVLVTSEYYTYQVIDSRAAKSLPLVVVSGIFASALTAWLSVLSEVAGLHKPSGACHYGLQSLG